MRGFHKSKRVTWASDVNLCQVRLFLSEDAPFQVRSGAQDHLQAKTSWPSSHSAGFGPDDALPPGFEAPQPSYQYQIKLSEIPLIRWRCPRRIVLNNAWRVVAGEESEETEVQSQRDMRVLEAVYPRESSIPQNPACSVESEESSQSDLHIPRIPITPIEDEETSADPSPSYSTAMVSQPSLGAPGIPRSSRIADERSGSEMTQSLEPDVLAVASTAVTAIMKSNEPGSTIDQELLIQILSNPKMIEKLVTEYGTGAVNTRSMPEAVAAPVALPTPHSATGAASSSGPFYPQPNGPNPRFPQATFSPAPSQPTIRPPPPPPPRDMNYYKNLIQQHGGERQEFSALQYGNNRPEPASTIISSNGPKLRDSKGKIMKPCIYFNSSRGCRNGAKCAYQHDSSVQPRVNSMGEVQNQKRMKLDREITGT